MKKFVSFLIIVSTVIVLDRIILLQTQTVLTAPIAAGFAAETTKPDAPKTEPPTPDSTKPAIPERPPRVRQTPRVLNAPKESTTTPAKPANPGTTPATPNTPPALTQPSATPPRTTPAPLAPGASPTTPTTPAAVPGPTTIRPALPSLPAPGVRPATTAPTTTAPATTPATTTPATTAPSTTAPAATTPAATTPATTAPATTTPAATTPATTAPATTTPATTAPATTAPATTAPATTTPATTAPATTAPATTAPATTAPATAAPVTPAATAPAPAAPALGAPGAINVIGPNQPPPEEPVKLNFNNAPLEQVLEYYSSLTGRTVLRPANLNATVTIKTQTDLPVPLAIQALETVLSMNGVSMLPFGEVFVRAVTKQDAPFEGIPTSDAEAAHLKEEDRFITQVVQLKNIKPSEIAQAVGVFAKNAGISVIAIDASQIMVLRESTAVVKRMLELVKKLDVVPELDYKLEVIPIKFGKVEDIYETMSSLISGQGSGIQPRTGATAARRGGASRTSTTGALGQQRQPNQPTTTPAGQSAFQQRLNQIVNRASTGGDLQLLGDARIVPDPRSNTLIVFANKQDMQMITNIVSKVDVLLAQVLIEAIILDVKINDNHEFGVSAVQNPKQLGKWTTAGGINNGQGFLSSVTNFSSGLPGGFSYFGKYAGDFDVALKALSSDNRANVLQTPRIQTSHAVTATFETGGTVPYVTSTYYGGGIGGGFGPSSSYQQLPVSTLLEVTPYITPDGLVVMEISQTIEEISGSTRIEGVGDVPNTSRRFATSTVSVRDQDTIFLGGFIKSEKSSNKSGVPYLKDVPLLGSLFRSKTTRNDRSELVVLLRPTILRTAVDAALAAQAERTHMPGVVAAEKIFKEEEQKLLEESQTPPKSRKKSRKQSP